MTPEEHYNKLSEPFKEDLKRLHYKETTVPALAKKYNVGPAMIYNCLTEFREFADIPLDEEEYQHFKNELEKNKYQLFGMANKRLSKQYFERYKKENSNASWHEFNKCQYICGSNEARKKLQEDVENRLEEKLKEVEHCRQVLRELQGE